MTTFEQAKREAALRHEKAQGGRASDNLTLRDYFAAKALPEAIRALDNPRRLPEDAPFEWGSRDDGMGFTSDQELAAEYAYTMADAMLKAREA